MKKPLLTFKLKGKDARKKGIYGVYNHEGMFLGVISHYRVGKFFHWIFEPARDTFYTNGCLDELREFMRGLYV